MKKNIFLLLTLITASLFGQAKLEYSIRQVALYVKSEYGIKKSKDDFWYDDLKKEYTYDEIGNLIIESEYNKSYGDNDSTWRKQKESVYSYNNQGKVVSLISSTSSDGINFEYSRKKEYTYNEEGDLKEIKNYVFYNLAWVNSVNQEFFYKNRILDFYLEDNNGVKERYKLSYNSDGKVESIYTSQWNGEMYVDERKDLYNYNSENKLEEIAYLSNYSDEWYHSSSDLREYDDYGNIISSAKFIIAYTINESKAWFSYDTDKLMEDYFHPFKNKTGLNLGSDHSYVNKLIDENSYWSNGSARVLYYYDDGIVTNTKDFELESVLIYPNPSKDFIRVELANDAIENIEIYNLLGEKVLVSASEIIAVKSLTSGVYLLKILTKEGEILTKRVVKN